MMLIMLGAYFAVVVIFLLSLEPTAEICAALVWLENLSFIFTFATILVKMWRIDRLVNR